MLRFCPNCQSILRPDRNKGKLVCYRCGHEEEIGKEGFRIKAPIVQRKKIKDIVVDEGDYGAKMPTASVPCPKCGNEEAYWWLVQTRRADEPPTTFYRCKKCGHTWRDYR